MLQSCDRARVPRWEKRRADRVGLGRCRPSIALDARTLEEEARCKPGRANCREGNSRTGHHALTADSSRPRAAKLVREGCHATPPFEHEDSSLPTYAPAWEFFLDHPYWLDDGDSPYLDQVAATGSLPPAWPDWCAIGAGNASIRVGECGGSEC